jgi:predicted ATPase
MFQNFVVRNFRCFSGLALRPLERVNLIAGKNNTGKTTLNQPNRLALFDFGAYAGPFHIPRAVR